MQLLAKFQKILYLGFRAALNFRIFKVALNPMYRGFSNFAKSCISSCLTKFYNKKNFTAPFLKYKRLKLKLRVFLAGHSVAMVTYSDTKIICCFKLKAHTRKYWGDSLAFWCKTDSS